MIKKLKSNRLFLIFACVVGLIIIALAVKCIYSLILNGGKSEEDLLTIVSDEIFESNNLDELNITIDQSNLPKKGENIEVKASPEIKLKKSNKGEKIVNGYFLYLSVSENTFAYSTNRNLPEVVLTVIDPYGKELTSIDGFNYSTTFGVSGFDITGFTGSIKIAIDNEIYSTENKDALDKWDIKITYLSLDNNNTTNSNAIFKSKINVYGRSQSLNNYIKNIYTSDGENDLYFHDSLGDFSEYETGDYSYRYSGKNPNNYICLNNDTNCQNDYLYRIIGVYPLGDNYFIKVIKASELSLDSNPDNLYYWSGSIDNLSTNWQESSLNKDVLNNTVVELINKNNIIFDAPWTNKVDISKTKDEDNNNEYYSKVGLMYVSDYYYSSIPSNWQVLGTGSDNWLYIGKSEWTLSKDSNGVYYIDDTGKVSTSSTINPYVVRPVFYLDNSLIVSGEHKGTISDPYRFI